MPRLGGNLPASVETLADRIAREGPLNELDAVGWAIRLAKGIETMHALGVTHGSLSPKGFLLDGTDRSARAQLVDMRRAPASLACQSPERIQGGGLSVADDTWALSCVLYNMLTGSLPFSGVNDADLKQKVLASSPAPLAVFDVGDDDLQRILDEAFAKDLAHRISSVGTLRAALEEWHPDPNVGALPAVEEEDADAAGPDDDDDDQRTIMRSSPGTAPRIHLPIGLTPPVGFVTQAAAPAAPPPADDDEEGDERTVMRTAPEHVVRAGALAPLHGASEGEPDDEEATRMLPSPALQSADDEDDQATLMRPSLSPDEIAARQAAARPLPAAGARPQAVDTPSVSFAFPAPPAPPARPAEPAQPFVAAAPMPPASVMGAAPLTVASAAPVAASPPPRRVALWIALAAVIIVAIATFFVLRMG